MIWVGPETYRISFNAYMVSNAAAISSIATLTGNTSVAAEWANVSATLYDNMNTQMYNDDINFWIDVIESGNIPAVGRQLIAYYPYRFGVGLEESKVRGLEAGLDSEHFITEFGPTTLEQTNEYFTAFKNLTYCCLWNGQSWPFSTSVYLGTLARLARDNVSSVATPELFQSAMDTYTRTNYKDGEPFTGEAHYPTIDAWSGYTSNHSEHYFHSTYFDNVFTNLLGIVPSIDDRLDMRPLVPSNWSYFMIEGLPYHGEFKLASRRSARKNWGPLSSSCLTKSFSCYERSVQMMV